MGRKAWDTSEPLAGGGAPHPLHALCQVLSDELVTWGADRNSTVAHRAVRVGAAESVPVVTHRKADHNRRNRCGVKTRASKRSETGS